MEPSIQQTLRDALAGRSEIRFALLYGSVLQRASFRDIDIALMVDRAVVPVARDIDYILALTSELQPALSVPLDMHVINDAPLPFQYNVSRGKPLIVNDQQALCTFLERTWDMYLDFQPVAMRYLEELKCKR